MTGLGQEASLAALTRGEVVILDTDTLPGLHALATSDGAAARLAALKGHPPDRPYLLLVPTAEAAFRLGRAATEAQEARLRGLWPAPLTALLRPADDTPPAWAHEGRSVAVRVPALSALRRLLEALGGPLFSTSVNRAGESPAPDLDAARAAFPDLHFLDFGEGGVGAASTIVDCTGEPARIVRAGTVAFETE